ncbi:SPOR domain-containing protein [Thiomicrorhabdus sp.]|uniref:SPOR domain-containing protein n=1 Tax=Thiomicrorhabdus sp. TaxID=2039724 RepID=UPI0029C983D0|nr:SPOR domain-containing protein [Thiomicrorhabdus sp.]
MARDYRHRHAAPRQTYQRRSQQKKTVQTQSSSSKWIWFGGFMVSFGLLSGYFIADHFVTLGMKSASEGQQASIFAHSGNEKNASALGQEGKTQPLEVEALNIPAPAEELVPQEALKSPYRFYDDLVEQKMQVDAEPLSVQLDAPYYVIAGTFGSLEVAKKEQARLAKYGQIVNLNEYKTATRTYYRLRIGPFTDRLVLNKRRNELRRLGVDTLKVKAPVADK